MRSLECADLSALGVAADLSQPPPLNAALSRPVDGEKAIVRFRESSGNTAQQHYMAAGSGDRRIVPGLMAGLFGSVAGLVLVYVISLVIIFLKDQELLGTLLVAVTYLPLMLIFVFFFPNLALGIILGLLLGFLNLRKGLLLSFIIAAVIGFLFMELGFSLILPLVIPPEPGDFVTIVSNRFLTGAYGLTLGILTNGFLRWSWRG